MAKRTHVKTAHLKAKLSAYLKRAGRGETLIVLDRNTPIAQLGPLPKQQSSGLAALIADGRVTAGNPGPEPFAGMSEPRPIQDILTEIRAER